MNTFKNVKEFSLRTFLAVLATGIFLLSLCATLVIYAEPVIANHTEVDTPIVKYVEYSQDLGKLISKNVADSKPIEFMVNDSSESIEYDGISDSVQVILVSNSEHLEAENDYFYEDDVSEVLDSDEGLIFDPLDITKPSNISREQLEYFISIRCPEWVGLEDYILELDQRINLVFFLTVGRLETGAGYDVVGDYNCFNTRDFYTLEYVDYGSYIESIDAFVNLILYQYVDPDGMWHEVYVDENGISRNAAVFGICQHYADIEWGYHVIDLAYEIQEMLIEYEAGE